MDAGGTTRLSAQSSADGVALHPLLRTWGKYLPLVAIRGDMAIDALQREFDKSQAADHVERPRLRAQDADLLVDGRHYETRIAECGILATRAGNAHDLFNALVWLRHPHLKHALNVRQVADIARVGPKQRTRGQCALTHFDEAGAIVWLANPAVLPLWDAHDWPALFVRERAAWGRDISVTAFGHALTEHVWNGNTMPVAKALVVVVKRQDLSRHPVNKTALLQRWAEAEAFVAAAITKAELLSDPLELRPLPLAGIPGWHAASGGNAFVRDGACFRPLRVGRTYPAPLRFSDA